MPRSTLVSIATTICLIAASAEGARRPRATSTLRMSATAYCESGKTRSGERARRGIVAADPRVLPIGSRIRILEPKRYAGVYRVIDVGRGIKGRELDIFMPSCKHARTFGRRQVSVRVLPRDAE